MYEEKAYAKGQKFSDSEQDVASVPSVISRLEKVAAVLVDARNGLDYTIEKLHGPTPANEGELTKGSSSNSLLELVNRLEILSANINNRQNDVYNTL
jgi:hypothetical protein